MNKEALDEETVELQSRKSNLAFHVWVHVEIRGMHACRISRQLIERLLALPRKSRKVFGGTQLRTMRRVYQKSRNKIAATARNLRLTQINFHTFRHWKATTEYHRTKDIIHVMRILGHRSIKNTLIYTHLVDFKDSDYTSKVAWNLDEACKLVEAGFKYVCEVEEGKIFRKPK